jgi:D-beta-D-heptose 7-phosphate kinase / D-beta-D-heptose 1-phosphate adenosyltransferase
MRGDLIKAISEFKSIKVLVIGDAILDSYIKGTSDRLCREAPVPVINVYDQEFDCGGAANTAINLAALGAETHFISVTGKDESAGHLLKKLTDRKVNTRCVIQDKTRRTLTKRRVTASSNILLRIDDGSTHPLSDVCLRDLKIKIRKIYKTVDAIVLSDYSYGIVSDDLIHFIEELNRKTRKIIVVDSKNPERYKILRPAAVKPNYEEAINMLNIPRLMESERINQIKNNGGLLLEKTGAECVAATMDTDGVWIFANGKEPYRISASPQDNKKAIGAGDTFISALTLALAVNADFYGAAEIASAAAALVLQKDGTVVCTGAELKSFLTENPKYLQHRKELPERIDDLKKEGKKIVFTNGCFDILHRGHVSLLNQAKQLGDILIVGINSDASIKRLKGNERPINNLEDRMMVLAGLQFVDYLVPFDQDSPDELIKLIKPDFFVKGGDYTIDKLPEAKLIKSLGGEIRIFPFVDDKSTTLIINKIKTTVENGIRNFGYGKKVGLE